MRMNLLQAETAMRLADFLYKLGLVSSTAYKRVEEQLEEQLEERWKKDGLKYF